MTEFGCVMDFNFNLGGPVNSTGVNSQEEELRLLHSVAEKIGRDYPSVIPVNFLMLTA